ncbi:MAG TPA: hypothetical protein PKZ78_10995, partial [Candidatus Goldiibacteriota bacterium]|nr:hypothetical protein [Candidatus Goldiibacteriota bacterium]
DKELGAAVEKRDYKLIKKLLKTGADINQCILKTGVAGAGMFPVCNAVGYAVREKDTALLKFLLDNGGAIADVKTPISGPPNMLSKAYGVDVHEIMCRTAIKRLLLKRDSVNEELVTVVLNYVGIKKDSFLVNELLAAGRQGNAEMAGKLLKLILESNNCSDIVK